MPNKPPDDLSKASLDDRIRWVELELIAREERLWRGAATLRVSAQDRLHPRRLLPSPAVVVSIVVAGAAGLMLWRRRANSRADPASETGHLRASVITRTGLASMAGLVAAVPWVAVVNLVWPLLPAGLRRYAAPGLVGTGLSMVVPWMAHWLTPRDADLSQRQGSSQGA